MDIGESLKGMLQLHPEFSLKIGQKGGILVAEMRIAGHKPGAAMGDDLASVLSRAHGQAVQNIAERLLAESRLNEAIFDNAVAKLEDDGCGRPSCCCQYCDEDGNEDEDGNW